MIFRNQQMKYPSGRIPTFQDKRLMYYTTRFYPMKLSLPQIVELEKIKLFAV